MKFESHISALLPLDIYCNCNGHSAQTYNGYNRDPKATSQDVTFKFQIDLTRWIFMDFQNFYIFEEEIIPSRAWKDGIIVFHAGKQRDYAGIIFLTL